MVWIPFIYFSLLSYYFYKKADNTISPAVVLCGFYVISSLMSILIDIRDLYGEYGTNPKELSLSATFIYCAGLTAILIPFARLKLSTTEFTLRNPRLFSITCYFICACIAIYLFANFQDIIHALVTDADEVKAEHYSVIGDNAERGSQALWMYLPNIFSSAWCLVLLCWFVSITFLKKNILFNAMLLVSSFVGVLKGALIAGRSAIIYWIFCFAVYLIFFQLYMPKSQRRKILLGSLVPIGLIAVFFISITISRFAHNASENSLDSFIGYAGQMYVNFCSVYENAKNLPFTIERIAPLAYRHILGQDFNLMDYYARLSADTGILVNVFYTLLGGLYMTIGGLGTFAYVGIFYFIASYICKKITETCDFSYIILLSIIVLVPIKGMFDVPFPSTSDSLTIFITIILCFIFKYSFIASPKTTNDKR